MYWRYCTLLEYEEPGNRYFGGVITASVRSVAPPSRIAICLPSGDQLIATGPAAGPCARTKAARARYEYSISRRSGSTTPGMAVSIIASLEAGENTIVLCANTAG